MKTIKKRCPLLPLRDLVVFPNSVVPLFVGREKSIASLDEAMNVYSREIFLATQKTPRALDATLDDVYQTGTLAQILQILRLPDNTIKILVEGKSRARIVKNIESERVFLVEVEVLPDEESVPSEKEALLRAVKSTFDTYVKLNKKIPSENWYAILNLEDEGKLADTLSAQLVNLKFHEKQSLIEITNPTKRLEKVFMLLQSEIEILRLEKKIRSRVKKQMEKTQKEYYLNEQINAIQKELGHQDDFRLEIMNIESRLSELDMPEEIMTKIRRETKKLQGMNQMSAEATVVRNYIDVVLSLPWGKPEKIEFDYKESVKRLDQDHYGLENIKSRILEYLFVYCYSPSTKPPILCLWGPPGVGKSSLAKSIAKAMGREFARISLGGLRDEAEIRGHRRTYIGAMPGKIINAMRKVKTTNPVILLDEIDKMSADFRGDPAAALLEVLDQDQNKTFCDHYLDLDYDLSNVLFIATANNINQIPLPLMDRMEMIHISGYTDLEKMAIAEKHLLPRCLENLGLEKSELHFEKEAIVELIHHYTREVGVRNLEREIANILRKSVKEQIEKGQTPDKIHVTPHDVHRLLGPGKYHLYKTAQRRNEVGLAQGMAYTVYGGDLLMTEVAILQGKGTLQASGKLGEVMKESTQAALSFIRLRADLMSLYSNFYSNIDIHIHFPEGATPKDGPSAGVTIAVALFSALTNRPVRSDVAMTGEITLRGRVLGVGGIKEKLLAAHRARIKTALIPRENEKDLYEIPPEVKEQLEIKLIEYVDEAILESIEWKEEDFLKHRLEKNAYQNANNMVSPPSNLRVVLDASQSSIDKWVTPQNPNSNR